MDIGKSNSRFQLFFLLHCLPDSPKNCIIHITELSQTLFFLNSLNSNLYNYSDISQNQIEICLIFKPTKTDHDYCTVCLALQKLYCFFKIINVFNSSVSNLRNFFDISQKHRLQTPNEGIQQRNLTIWVDVAVPKREWE